MKTYKLMRLLAITGLMVAGLSFTAQAQGSISYSFTRNEPYRLKWLGQVNFFKMDCGFFDPFNLQAGLAFDYFLPKTLSFHADWSTSYWGAETSDLKNTNNDNNTVASYSNLEAGIRFHIIDRPGKHKMKITQASWTEGNINHEVSAKMEFPTRNIIGLRGGVYTATMPVTTEWNVKNPTTLTAIGNYTDMHTTGIYAGFSSIFVINASWTQDGDYSGDFYKMWYREFYADVIYTPVVTFDDIVTGTTKTPVKANTPDGFSVNSLGWRIGWNKLTPRSGRLSFGFELGMKPGVMGKQLYFGCTMGISIANRMKDKK